VQQEQQQQDSKKEFCQMIKKKQFDFSLTEIKEQGLDFTVPPPEAVTCVFCRQSIEPKGMMHPFENRIWLWLEPECVCTGAVQEKKRKEEEEKEKELQRQKKEKIEKLFQDSRLSLRFRNRTFDNFEVTDSNRKAYEISKKYAEGFEKYRERGMGLIFTGPYGTGKTHLACAIAIKLMNSGIPVIVGTLISLLEKIKQSWRDRSVDEWEVIDIYSKVDLLVIDDLGKERPSEWALEKLYSIINDRYENMMPVIITSNFSGDSFINRLTVKDNDSTGRAIQSRLNEICSGIYLDGEDWRMK